MSRSYKKIPYCGERKGKAKKRIANHAVRRALARDPDLVINHGLYRKQYETYDICDYFWIKSWETFWKNELESYYSRVKRFGRSKIKPPDKKESYRYWLRCDRNK